MAATELKHAWRRRRGLPLQAAHGSVTLTEPSVGAAEPPPPTAACGAAGARPNLSAIFNSVLSFKDAHAQGMDISQPVLSADQWPPEPAYMRLTKAFFDDHKQFKAKLREDFKKIVQEEACLPLLLHMEPGLHTRPSTVNWRPTPTHGRTLHFSANSGTMRDGFELMSEAQVFGKLNEYCGEVRTWQVGPERWLRIDDSIASWERLGGDHYQTSVSKTRELRTAACGASIEDSVFSMAWEAVGCSPDFDNAISTFAVYDAVEPTKICIRQVQGITLAEVFSHYLEENPYEFLMSAWLEGKILVKTRERHEQRRRRG